MGWLLRALLTCCFDFVLLFVALFYYLDSCFDCLVCRYFLLLGLVFVGVLCLVCLAD